MLDALDECKDVGTTSVILSSLSRFVTELSPIRFLVTSCPEPHITTAFESPELNSATRRLILHEVELGIVGNDITLYLSETLGATRTRYFLDSTWPSSEDIGVLDTPPQVYVDSHWTPCTICRLYIDYT